MTEGFATIWALSDASSLDPLAIQEDGYKCFLYSIVSTSRRRLFTRIMAMSLTAIAMNRTIANRYL